MLGSSWARTTWQITTGFNFAGRPKRTTRCSRATFIQCRVRSISKSRSNWINIPRMLNSIFPVAVDVSMCSWMDITVHLWSRSLRQFPEGKVGNGQGSQVGKRPVYPHAQQIENTTKSWLSRLAPDAFSLKKSTSYTSTPACFNAASLRAQPWSEVETREYPKPFLSAKPYLLSNYFYVNFMGVKNGYFRWLKWPIKKGMIW